MIAFEKSVFSEPEVAKLCEEEVVDRTKIFKEPLLSALVRLREMRVASPSGSS